MKRDERIEQMKAHSKDLLIQAAAKLFAQKGYENVRIKDIAEQAGLSVGLVYNYYESKNMLLLAVFEKGMQDVQKSLAINSQEIQHPFERIEKHIHSTIKILQEHKDFWHLLHALRFQPTVMQSLSNEIAKFRTDVYQTLINNFQQVGVTNPEAEAFLLFALIDGIAENYVSEANYPIEIIQTYLIQHYKNYCNA